MYLAVFGDVHGNLDDMYGYCKLWEEKHNQVIAVVLQCGDIGMFPPDSLLDSATISHANRDPTELGAKDYITGDKRASHPTVFVRGNHEDFDFLYQFSEGGFVDPYESIYYLSSFHAFQLDSEDGGLVVAGLGGISPRGEWERGRRYFSDFECDALLKLSPGSVDILLTHDAPEGYGLRHRSGTGAVEISLIIEHLQPRLAFFGHYGYPPAPFHLGETLCVGMNNPDFLQLPRRDGSMGIIDTESWSFEFIQREEFRQ